MSRASGDVREISSRDEHLANPPRRPLTQDRDHAIRAFVDRLPRGVEGELVGRALEHVLVLRACLTDRSITALALALLEDLERAGHRDESRAVRDRGRERFGALEHGI